MAFGDSQGMINSGLPPSAPVICEPVPIPQSSVMTCRRGRGQYTFQGQKPPTCDGLLEVRVRAAGETISVLSCNKCGLSHATAEKNGIKIYRPIF